MRLALFIISTILYSHVMAENFSGYYAGIMTSYIQSQGQQDLKFDGDKVSTPAFYNLQQKSHKNNIAPELLIGYGQFWNQYYLGAEAYMALGGPKISMQTTDIKTTIKKEVGIGVSMRLGIQHAKFLGYARAGAEVAKIRQQTEFVAGGRYNSGSMLLSDIHDNTYALGLRTGIGMEYILTPSLNLRLEYTYSLYETLQTNIKHRTITFLNPIGTNRYKLSSNQVSLGLQFKL